MIDWDLGDTQLILDECRAEGLSDFHTAYVLATAYWETARTMKPVKEAYWLSENWRRKNLRYYPWYGRGYVQLTWERNYQKAGDILGVDLVGDKELALDSKVAAKVIVRGMVDGWFTGKKMANYSNFKDMRRVVNGTDKAADIAAIADEYYEALKDAPKPVEPTPPAPTGIIALIVSILKGLFK